MGVFEKENKEELFAVYVAYLMSYADAFANSFTAKLYERRRKTCKAMAKLDGMGRR